MAVSKKYGKVTLELGDIGEDEPVFVVRAQDLAAPSVVRQYKFLCEAMKAPGDLLFELDDQMLEIRRWQSKNRTKIPGTSFKKEATGSE